MFFFRRKNKNRPDPAPASSPIPAKFIYYLRKEHDANMDFFCLSHSSPVNPYAPENADRENFAAISGEILAAAFSGRWVSAWVRNGSPGDYLFPDGQRCAPESCFSDAFREYADRDGLTDPFVSQNGQIAVFSQGFFTPVFSSYLSDISNDALFDRELRFYGYRQTFVPTKDYETERRRSETLPWDLHAYYDDLHDNLYLFVKTPHDTAALCRTVERICAKYGKELRLVNIEVPL